MRTRPPDTDVHIDAWSSGTRAHEEPRGAATAPGHVLLMFQPVVGGVPEYVANLAEGLAQRRWRVSVAAPSDTPLLDRLRRVASHVLALDTSSGPSAVADARICRELVGFCRRHDVDIIHAHSSKAGALAAIAGKIARIETVYSPHAWSFQRELSPLARRAYVAAERLLVRRHAAVIAVADAERVAAGHARVVDHGRVTLVHTGLRGATLPSTEQSRSVLDLDANGFVVGWVGRLGPQKCAEHLPVIAAELGTSATLAVLGYGLPGSDVGLALADLRATVTATVDPQTIYAASNAFAITSRWEGFPLVVLEAMRAGLPVVAYDVGGLREQIDHGVTGYLVPPEDPQELAARLRELAADPELTRRMGIAARQRFVDLFGFEQMVASIERIYGRVLDCATPVERPFDVAPAWPVSGR